MKTLEWREAVQCRSDGGDGTKGPKNDGIGSLEENVNVKCTVVRSIGSSPL